jgi:hypothetical protein
MDHELNSDAWIGLREFREIQAALVPELMEVMEVPLTAFFDDVESILKGEELEALIRTGGGLSSAFDKERSVEDMVKYISSLDENLDPILVGSVAVSCLINDLNLPRSNPLSAVCDAWKTGRKGLVVSAERLGLRELRNVQAGLDPELKLLTEAPLTAFLNDIEAAIEGNPLADVADFDGLPGYLDRDLPKTTAELVKLMRLLRQSNQPLDQVVLGSIVMFYCYGLVDKGISLPVDAVYAAWKTARADKAKGRPGPVANAADIEKRTYLMFFMEVLEDDGLTENAARKKVQWITGFDAQKVRNELKLGGVEVQSHQYRLPPKAHPTPAA